jgi:hypothetical protein
VEGNLAVPDFAALVGDIDRMYRELLPLRLSWALENGQEAGIWSGTTEEERRHLRRHPRSGLTRTGGITDGGGPCTSLTPNQKI